MSAAFLHLFWMLLIDLESRLNNHHVALVFLADMTNVAHAIGDNVVSLQFGVSFHRPIGIERHTNHIPPTTILAHDVEIPVVERLLMTAVEMHDDDGFWKHLLHRIVACTDEARILLWILLDVSHRPEQSVGGLVAHLHPARLDVVFLQEREHLNGMLCEVALHLLVAVSLPGFGNRLLGGVGPRVAIVEVHHELHAQRLHTTRHRKEFVFVARAAPWVHPHTHANGRHLVVVLQ